MLLEEPAEVGDIPGDQLDGVDALHRRRLSEVDEDRLLLMVEDIVFREIAMHESTLNKPLEMCHRLCIENIDVFRDLVLHFWRGVVVTDEVHDDDVIQESPRHRTSDARIPRDHEVTEFPLAPGEDDLPPLALETAEARIELDGIIEAIEITGLEAIDLDDDRALLPFIPCGEDIGFLAEGDRAHQLVEMALGGELEEGAFAMLVKDVLVRLEAFMRGMWSVKHGQTRGAYFYIPLGKANCLLTM